MIGTVSSEVVGMDDLRVWNPYKGMGTLSRNDKTGTTKIKFDGGDALMLFDAKDETLVEPTPHPSRHDRQLTLDLDV